MSSGVFKIEANNHISHLQLSRPDDLNSLTGGFWDEFPASIESLVSANETRVLVISSTGRHFTAGMDFSVFAGLAGDETAEPARTNDALAELIRRLQKTFACTSLIYFEIEYAQLSRAGDFKHGSVGCVMSSNSGQVVGKTRGIVRGDSPYSGNRDIYFPFTVCCRIANV